MKNKNKNKNKSILFLFLLAIFIWAPLPYGSFTERYWHLLIALVAVLAAVVSIGLIFNKQQLSPVLRKHWLPVVGLLLFQCWVLAQYLLGITLIPYYTLVELQLGIGYTLLFVLCLQLIDSQQKLRTFAVAFVLAGTFQAFFGSFMTLSGIEYNLFGPKDRFIGVATGTYIARTHFAGFMEMCLAVGIGLMLSQLRTDSSKNWQDRWHRLLETLLSPKFRLRLYLVIMVVGLVLSRSRMGNAAFFVSATLCGLLWLFIQWRYRKGEQLLPRNVLIFFISMAVIDVLIVSNWFGLEELVERIEQTTIESEQRDEAVRDAAKVWQDYKLTGAGGGTFYFVFTQYRETDVQKTFDTAYNDYVELSAEYGIIGMIPLALVVLYCLWQGIRAQIERRSRFMQGMGFASTMGIVSILIHSFSDFNLQIPANALSFMVILAFGCLARHLPSDKRSRS